MFRSGLLLLSLVLLVIDANSQTEYKFPSVKFKGLDIVPFNFKPGERVDLSELNSLLNGNSGKIKPVEIPTAKIPETFTDLMPNGWPKSRVLPFIPNSIPVVPSERK